VKYFLQDFGSWVRNEPLLQFEHFVSFVCFDLASSLSLDTPSGLSDCGA